VLTLPCWEASRHLGWGFKRCTLAGCAGWWAGLVGQQLLPAAVRLNRPAVGGWCAQQGVAGGHGRACGCRANPSTPPPPPQGAGRPGKGLSAAECRWGGAGQPWQPRRGGWPGPYAAPPHAGLPGGTRTRPFSFRCHTAGRAHTGRGGRKEQRARLNLGFEQNTRGKAGGKVGEIRTDGGKQAEMR